MNPKELLEQLENRERFRQQNKLLFLSLLPEQPPWPELRLNKPQMQLMSCVTKDGKIPRRIIMVGANKTTKTTSATFRGICLACGEHPFLPDNHPLRYTTKQIPIPNVGVVLGEELTQSVEKKLVPLYQEWIPKICEPLPKRNTQGVVTRILLKKDFHGEPLGSVIYFGSYSKKSETYEGIDFHWTHWDEPSPNDTFVSVERGLVAYGGISFMALTSLKEPWVKPFADTSIDYGGNDERLRIVEFGDIWQNHYDNGGFLTTENIDDFIKIVSKEEYGTRILGEWLQTGSLIFQTFKDDYPYICSNFDIPSNWTWYEAVNPHDGKDTIWLFFAVSPHEVTILGDVVHRLFLVDYLRLPPSMTITDMVAEVKHKRVDLKYQEPYYIVMDAKHGRRRQIVLREEDPATWQDKLEDVGIGDIELADQKPGDVEFGHKVVREYFRPQLWKVQEEEVPGVVILERCRGQEGPVTALLNYRMKKESNEPVSDEFKEVVDPLRYLLMKFPTYVEKSSWMYKDRLTTVVNKYAGR